MDTLVITGGAGFIGCNFTRLALAKTKMQIVVIDKLTYAGNLCSLDDLSENPFFQFQHGDIADRGFLQSFFQNFQPTWILNLAAETHVDRSIDDPDSFVNTNLLGTFELLRATQKYYNQLEGNIKQQFRFLHVSTDEVYGSLFAGNKFSETTAYAPNSPYAASKAGADHMVRAYYKTYKLPSIITNCSNNYGPYQFPEKLIPLIIMNAIEGKPLPIYGDGSNIRDWLYVEDHCKGILLALQQGLPREKYNIGGKNEKTNLEIVNQVCSSLEEILPARENPTMCKKGIPSYSSLMTLVTDRPGHDKHYSIDSTKIRHQLGWKPRYNLTQGISKTVHWYYNNQKWCREVQKNNYDRERLGLKKDLRL